MVIAAVEPCLVLCVIVISLGSTGRRREPELLVGRLLVDHIGALVTKFESHDSALLERKKERKKSRGCQFKKMFFLFFFGSLPVGRR